jgi:Pyruvate/2-oxoacid:ferredoxin oxidoreductase delta subunit
MQFHQGHVRGISVEPVQEADRKALAAVLTYQPAELLLTAQGAVIPPSAPGRPRQRIQDGAAAAVALAKRNVRSLLCCSRDGDEVDEALQIALTAPAREAEAALEDAGLEVNLRYGIFATPDAAILVQEHTLVITDGSATTVSIARRDVRSQAGAFFGPQAVARLAAIDVEEVRLSPSAISPVWMQMEPGAVMSPDTAHRRMHKGGCRAVRKPDFVKAYCVSCGRCFIHCPDNAIIHAAYDRQARETTGILGIDTERCTACGLCAAVCPTNRDGHKAIVMIEAGAESSPCLHCVG